MTNGQLFFRIIIIAVALYTIPDALAWALERMTIALTGFRNVSLDFFRFFAYMLVLAGIAMYVFGAKKKA